MDEETPQSPQANFERARSERPLSTQEVQQARQFARAMDNKVFDPNKGDVEKADFNDAYRTNQYGDRIRVESKIRQASGNSPRLATRQPTGQPTASQPTMSQPTGQTTGPTTEEPAVADFNEPYKSNQYGQRLEIDSNISQSSKNSPSLSTTKTHTSSFDWGGFSNNLAKVRRQTLGQSELENQISSILGEDPSRFFKSISQPQPSPIFDYGDDDYTNNLFA